MRLNSYVLDATNNTVANGMAVKYTGCRETFRCSQSSARWGRSFYTITLFTYKPAIAHAGCGHCG